MNFTQSSSCTADQYGYNVCVESSTLNGPTLNQGTYWVSLQNASVPGGDPVYWDENSGQSLAEQNDVGSIPSESFTILGETTTTTTTSIQNQCVPEQDGNFTIIHDFTGGADGNFPSGVAIDRAGRLYGPAQNNGGGTVYRLAQAASGWVLDTLYNFPFGAGANSPAGVIVGKNDILYGAAQGGLQNCNGYYCGFIFDLRPEPSACVSATCSWMENTVYNFTVPTDASGGGALVSDQAGNLYGVSGSGGAHQKGAVFELSPSIGGWTENILYSFTGGADGGGPTDIIVGKDGNLYGMAAGGGSIGLGVVFELTPSGSDWSESVLYNIPFGEGVGSNPHSLIQDSAGNLYGIYQYAGCCDNPTGVIFMLSPAGGNWVFTELHHGNDQLPGDDVFLNMTIDTGGNLLGTEKSDSGCMNDVAYASIFELTQSGGGWQFNYLKEWGLTVWLPSGSLATDGLGDLYGTTQWCGAHNAGAVWKLSGVQ